MSSTCGVCSDKLGPASGVLSCAGDCGKSFHYSCVKDADEKKLRSSKNWKCKDCKPLASAHSSTSSSSGTTVTKEFLLRVLEEFKVEVFKELQSFKDEMADFKKSLSFMSDKLDASNNLMAEFKKELSAVKNENEALRASNTVLNKTVCELQDRMRSLEQYTRRSNIEVSGVPVTPQENVMDIIKDVGKALGVDMNNTHIVAAHRVPTYRKDRTPTLVVQFSSKAERDVWVGKFKEKRGAFTADKVNSTFASSSRVYVNEHLSPDNKIFLSMLKKKCQEIGYSFVWCRDGKFFVRRADGEKCIRINSLAEINSLK